MAALVVEAAEVAVAAVAMSDPLAHLLPQADQVTHGPRQELLRLRPERVKLQQTHKG